MSLIHNPIGIMQGRLVSSPMGKLQAFPIEKWEMEFPIAAEVGFQAIEWLLDADTGLENPLLSGKRRDRIRELIREHGVRIHSVCADYLQFFPLFLLPGDIRRRREIQLTRSIEAAQQVGAEAIVIPCGGQDLRPNSPQEDALKSALEPVLERAGQVGVKVGLEMDWAATEQISLVQQIGHPALGVYYDLGNAASRGYLPAEEIRSLGSILVGVHVKDRKIQGPSVFLGEGDTDFPSAFRALQEIDYQGPFILETPRGDDPLDAARRNLAFVRGVLNPLGSKKGARDECFQKHKRAI